jgi:ABC-type uncharacterized transport system permease subunit
LQYKGLVQLPDLSLFWLRVAAALYSVGLADALIRLLRRHSPLFPYAFAAFAAGALFHFVALVELSVAQRHLAANNFFETASLCALLLAAVYLLIHWRLRFELLSVFVFPLVFVLTFIGARGAPGPGWADPRVRNVWLLTHILLVLAGYTALLLAAGGAVFYLLGERRLKRKASPGPALFGLVAADQLPPLETLDTFITRAMSVGCVAITLAVVAASSYAFIETGTRWISKPEIVVSLITWFFYLLMVFLRLSAGWRGRKAALLTLTVLGFAAVTWAAHVGLRPLLER